MAKGINVAYPITKGNTGFFKQTFDTMSAIKSKINVLFKTIEGERPFNPEFGLGLYRYVFEQLTPELNNIIQDKIYDKVTHYIPEVIIQDVQINQEYTTDIDRNKLVISISFSLKNNPNEIELMNVNIE